jgi:hypothetical protein
MKPWQIGVVLYGILYMLLAYAMEVDNLRHDYSIAYIAASILAQCIVVCGIFLFALDAGPDFAKVWRWLFPWLLCEVAVGIVLDATIPPDFNLYTHGAEWIVNLLFSLWLATPAYYFNYRIARYRDA